MPWVLAAVAVAGVGACGSEQDRLQSRAQAADWPDRTSSLSAPARDEAPAPAGPRTAATPEMGYTAGNPDAPIRVVEFSDFGCGYCRLFHQETYPSLYREFVEAGTVHWTYVPFELGMFPNGGVAALAGECAGAQGMFEPMRDHLFDSQAEWRRTSDAVPLFEGYARESGLDAGAFASCMRSGERKPQVERNNAAAREAGIRGTPTFFVNGFPVQGAIPLPVFRDFLNAVLAELRKGEPR